MHTKKYDPQETHIVYKGPVFDPSEADLEKEWIKEKGDHGEIIQPVDTFPETGTYTTAASDITLEVDYIYFFEDDTQANPEDVIFVYRNTDGEEFTFDAQFAITNEICEGDDGLYEIVSVEKILV